MNIVRAIDKSGRIMIPANIREVLGLYGERKVTLELTDDNTLTIRPLPQEERRCNFCGTTENIVTAEDADGFHVCAECAEKILAAAKDGIVIA